ncbi:MAG: ferrochelatase [Gammaproteobacteria bacterium]|jgi:ferrochelatase
MPAPFDESPHVYDAILVVSFGGPEGPDDVMPFLENVLRGLPIKPESKAAIARRYQDYDGVSPINAEVRRFIGALNEELKSNGPELPIYWGNRNWHPMLGDTLRQMRDDGVRNAIAFVTSMFSSYSGCRKYREDLYAAVDGLDHAPNIDKLRLGFNHPSFIEAVSDRARDAIAQSEAAPAILFTAHSLPQPMANACRYQEQLESSCRLVAQELGVRDWSLVYQSNNASYGGPAWLGPDVSDALREAKSQGVTDVVVVPIGFVCDHMEVVIDLDVEAAAVARETGINMLRAATVGTHPAYVRMVRELILERMSAAPQRAALGELGASHDYCPVDCCLSGRPGPPKPALCGVDSA